MTAAVLDATSQKNEMVVMSNNLIRGTYKYSLAELRFILSVVSMIRADDTEFVTYQLGAKDFSELIDSKHKDEYTRIKKLGTDLMSKPIIIENKREGEFKIRSWFNMFDYKQGTIYCSFHNDLKPHLLQLKGTFTMLSLGNILRMKSRYAMLFYLIVKSWEGRGYFEMTVEDFKAKLDVKTKAYERYNNLKNKVIDVAITEINKLTEIRLSYEEIKIGRKITTLRFNIIRGNINVDHTNMGGGKTASPDEISEEASEIVDFFIAKRKEIQSEFDIYITSGKNDPYQTMQRHLAVGGRTKEQYINMISWIFGTDSDSASFWRKTIHEMEGLIKNFDKVEIAYIEENQDGQLTAKIQARVALMKKNNSTDEEIKTEINKIVTQHNRKKQLNLFS